MDKQGAKAIDGTNFDRLKVVNCSSNDSISILFRILFGGRLRTCTFVKDRLWYSAMADFVKHAMFDAVEF